MFVHDDSFLSWEVGLSTGLSLCQVVLAHNHTIIQLQINAVGSSHNPVGSDEGSTTGVSVFTIPLILQRDLQRLTMISRLLQHLAINLNLTF